VNAAAQQLAPGSFARGSEAFRRAAFFRKHGLYDPAGFGLAEPALAQEGFAVLSSRDVSGLNLVPPKPP